MKSNVSDPTESNVSGKSHTSNIVQKAYSLVGLADKQIPNCDPHTRNVINHI